MISRAERTPFGRWWWTIDRLLLAALVGLVLAGIVLSLAASPPVVERLNSLNSHQISMFHFVNRQVLFAFPAVLIMVFASTLSPRDVRRVALIVFVVALAMVAATLVVGQEIKGSRRWLTLPLLGSIQPSEFLKPAFVVITAWLFSESVQRRDVPATVLAFVVLGVVVALLVRQPDVGQTILVVLVWSSLFFLAGLHWIWVAGLAGLGAGGLVAAYAFVPHVTQRINRFLEPDKGDNYQVETALESFVSGGFFGRGPGEGVVKRGLPDSHTDFILAVTAEEFGVIVCLMLVAVFAFIVVRVLWQAMRAEDPFCRFAAAGLVLLFGFQSAINMAVNVHLVPAKGMTLPFISYGGSSLLSVAFAMGLVLALTRKRPRAEALSRLEKRERSP